MPFLCAGGLLGWVVGYRVFYGAAATPEKEPFQLPPYARVGLLKLLGGGTAWVIGGFTAANAPPGVFYPWMVVLAIAGIFFTVVGILRTVWRHRKAYFNPAPTLPNTGQKGRADFGNKRDLMRRGISLTMTKGNNRRAIYLGKFVDDPLGRHAICGESVFYHGHSHLLSIGPAGSGRGTGLIIPNLARLERRSSSWIPRAEAAAVTAAYRRKKFGAESVVVLNPFDLLVQYARLFGIKKATALIRCCILIQTTS